MNLNLNLNLNPIRKGSYGYNDDPFWIYDYVWKEAWYILNISGLTVFEEIQAGTHDEVNAKSGGLAWLIYEQDNRPEWL